MCFFCPEIGKMTIFIKKNGKIFARLKNLYYFCNVKREALEILQ